MSKEHNKNLVFSTERTVFHTCVFSTLVVMEDRETQFTLMYFLRGIVIKLLLHTLLPFYATILSLTVLDNL